MKETSYAILGMGRYGSKLALTLAATGAEILIADRNSQIVNEYADNVTRAVSLDLGNPVALQEIGLDLTDTVIIDLSEELEDTIMCTMIAREKGVKTIIATASTDIARDVLMRVGVDEVVIPEDEAAARMARRLISEGFMEYHDLGGGLCVVKVHAQKEWTKKRLRDLKLPERENVHIIAVEKDGVMEVDIDPDMVLTEESVVAVSIPKSQIYDLI